MQKQFRWSTIINLMLILILALALSACGGDDDSETDAAPDAPVTAQPSAAQADATTVPAQPKPPATEAAARAPAPPAADGNMLFVDLTELDSYRSRSVITPMQAEESMLTAFMGGISTMESEYVRDPQASRTVILDDEGNVTMEMISIQDQSWINMVGIGWMTAGPDDMDMAGGMTPEVEAMMRQIGGSMDRVGKETVNGVSAIHYTVDDEYEIPFPAPTSEELAQAEEDDFPVPTAMRGTVVGDIWIADERNLPPVVVRSVTTQEFGFVFDEKPQMDADMPPGMGFLYGEGTMRISEERDVTDINQPITIEAPTDAIDMGGLIPGAPEDTAGIVATAEALAETVAPSESEPMESPELGTGETLDVAPLSSLNSYMATLVTTIIAGGTEIATTLIEEWVADPPTRRVQLSAGGMAMQYVVAEDGAWVQMGGMWMPAEPGDVEDMRGELENYTSSVDNMVFVGSETVEGINTRYYQKSEGMTGQAQLTEVWVADEADLPSVVVKARYSMEMTAMSTVNEVLVTMINQPIVIEPPE